MSDSKVLLDLQDCDTQIMRSKRELDELPELKAIMVIDLYLTLEQLVLLDGDGLLTLYPAPPHALFPRGDERRGDRSAGGLCTI